MSSSTPSSSRQFVPATQEDSRSPCPALNALANHGYLAHDGRNLTATQIIHAIREVYHISLPMASVLSIAGTVVCGSGWKLDLEDLAKHNKIEHDGSLAHADALPGAKYAPSYVDKDRLQQLLDASSDGQTLTFNDLVSQRAARDAALSKPLDAIHQVITRGEVALTCEVLGDGGRVPKEYIRQWFGEERLPDGWKKPECPVGLIGTTKVSNKVATVAKILSKSET